MCQAIITLYLYSKLFFNVQTYKKKKVLQKLCKQKDDTRDVYKTRNGKQYERISFVRRQLKLTFRIRIINIVPKVI